MSFFLSFSYCSKEILCLNICLQGSHLVPSCRYSEKMHIIYLELYSLFFSLFKNFIHAYNAFGQFYLHSLSSNSSSIPPTTFPTSYVPITYASLGCQYVHESGPCTRAWAAFFSKDLGIIAEDCKLQRVDGCKKIVFSRWNKSWTQRLWLDAQDLHAQSQARAVSWTQFYLMLNFTRGQTAGKLHDNISVLILVDRC